jgi:hypothetical protein
VLTYNIHILSHTNAHSLSQTNKQAHTLNNITDNMRVSRMLHLSGKGKSIDTTNALIKTDKREWNNSWHIF